MKKTRKTHKVSKRSVMGQENQLVFRCDAITAKSVRGRAKAAGLTMAQFLRLACQYIIAKNPTIKVGFED